MTIPTLILGRGAPRGGKCGTAPKAPHLTTLPAPARRPGSAPPVPDAFRMPAGRPCETTADPGPPFSEYVGRGLRRRLRTGPGLSPFRGPAAAVVSSRPGEQVHGPGNRRVP